MSPTPGRREPVCHRFVLFPGEYFTGRTGRTVVIAVKPKFEKLADNTLESNRGIFNSSPTISGNRLRLRSHRALYSLGENCRRTQAPAECRSIYELPKGAVKLLGQPWETGPERPAKFTFKPGWNSIAQFSDDSKSSDAQKQEIDRE